MAQIPYRIKITRDGEQFEVEGDKAFVLKMIDRFESSDSTSKEKIRERKKTGQTSDKDLSTGKSLSVGEFIRSTGVKRHIDYVLAFAYFLEHHSGVEEFTPADINNCYYSAKIESSNTSMMITRHIHHGLIMEAKRKKGEGGKKKYTLTRTGEQHVKQIMSKKS